MTTLLTNRVALEDLLNRMVQELKKPGALHDAEDCLLYVALDKSYQIRLSVTSNQDDFMSGKSSGTIMEIPDPKEEAPENTKTC